MISPQSGAFPLKDSRMRRNSAYFCLCEKVGLALCIAACKRDFTVAVPQFYPVTVYHFRTPSPGGQQPFHNDMLPAFFSAPCSKCFNVSRKRVAMFQAWGFILDQMVSNSVSDNRKEPNPCRSNLYPSLLPPPSDLPLAVTPSVNKPCPVLSLAQPAQPSLTVTRAPVPSWVPLAGSHIARSRIAVTKRSRTRAPLFSNDREPDQHLRVHSKTLRINKGTHSCLSNRSFLPQSHPLASPPAVTASESKPLSVALSAVSAQQPLAVTPLQVQPWVQARTSSTAIRTPHGADALTRLTRPVFIHTQTSLCPSAQRRFAFLRPELRPTSEAPCSTSC